MGFVRIALLVFPPHLFDEFESLNDAFGLISDPAFQGGKSAVAPGHRLGHIAIAAKSRVAGTKVLLDEGPANLVASVLHLFPLVPHWNQRYRHARIVGRVAIRLSNTISIRLRIRNA